MCFKKLALLLVAIDLCSIAIKASALENLVYTWRGFPNQITQGTIAIDSLKTHAKQIDILSSQAYHIDENGVVFGSVNPQMIKIAADSYIKIMPLVGNANFDRHNTHLFLNNLTAQDRAIQSILQLCKENHFAGIQIDFEGMSFLDRAAFTHFYQKIANVLHRNGFKISIAIIPMLTNNIPANQYLKGRYEGWAGVYDYKLLGESSDFVTLMGYDQHGFITTPGPMAGNTWLESIIQYAIQYITPEKISLGIPWHSGYWYTGKEKNDTSFHAIATMLNYADTLRILNDNHATLKWDEIDKNHYAIFKNNFLYEYIFVENADSFKAKLDLVNKYKLRGVSNWCIGEEDPNVWKLISDRKYWR